jgi:hypothetical protein
LRAARVIHVEEHEGCGKAPNASTGRGQHPSFI